MSVVHKLDRKRGLDLLLHTPGGDMAATESIVDYLAEMFGTDIRAIVPQIAMSGGTLITLSCSKILMGKQSSIGPIDPQFGGMAATGLLQEIDKIKKEIQDDPSNALVWRPVLEQIRPGFITECENAIKWSKKMATRFLTQNMYKDNHDPKIVRNIVTQLTEKKNTFSHGRHISLAEAQRIFGDNIIALEHDNTLQDLVLTVHHAYMITLDATDKFKIIENHTGRAYMQGVEVRG